MLLMCERGIRGGVPMISKGHAAATNRYMSNYTPKQPPKFITYLDAYNLCGWAISKKLPTHGFKLMNPEELKIWDSFPQKIRVVF